jgi:hypothetical protein
MILNDKQTRLIKKLFDGETYYEGTNVFRTIKYHFLMGEEDSLYTNEFYYERKDLTSLNVDEVTPKYLKKLGEDHTFSHIKSFLYMINLIKKSITSNIFLTYKLVHHGSPEVASHLDRQPFFKIGKQEMLTQDAPPAALWLVFYDDDSKVLVYDKSPRLIFGRTKNSHGSNLRLRYQAALAFQASLNNDSRPKFFRLNHKIEDQRTDVIYFMDYKKIDIYKNKVINEIKENPIFIFDEELV